jgi:hypothetical protein
MAGVIPKKTEDKVYFVAEVRGSLVPNARAHIVVRISQDDAKRAQQLGQWIDAREKLIFKILDEEFPWPPRSNRKWLIERPYVKEQLEMCTAKELKELTALSVVERKARLFEMEEELFFNCQTIIGAFEKAAGDSWPDGREREREKRKLYETLDSLSYSQVRDMANRGGQSLDVSHLAQTRSATKDSDYSTIYREYQAITRFGPKPWEEKFFIIADPGHAYPEGKILSNQEFARLNRAALGRIGEEPGTTEPKKKPARMRN